MDNLANAQRRFDAALPSDYPAREDDSESSPPEHPPAGAIVTRSTLFVHVDMERVKAIVAASQRSQS